ncbi:unnamed protein product [Moneuplotes crassus]|uniref:Uncharacterized protein n=1 Tax=Euplotes crassus TaxID=5936 RepID=A0AAD1XDH2_EUPCR|nr:unnamed protein product [Moneuplotes crassus]
MSSIPEHSSSQGSSCEGWGVCLKQREPCPDREITCVASLSLPLQDILSKLQGFENDRDIVRILEKKCDFSVIRGDELAWLANSENPKFELASIVGCSQLLNQEDLFFDGFFSNDCEVALTKIFHETENIYRKTKILETLTFSIHSDYCQNIEESNYINIFVECINSQNEDMINFAMKGLGLIAEEKDAFQENIVEIGALQSIFRRLQTTIGNYQAQEIATSTAYNCVKEFEDLPKSERLEYLHIAVQCIQECQREEVTKNLMDITFQLCYSHELSDTLHRELPIISTILRKCHYMSLENCIPGIFCVTILSKIQKHHESILCQDFYDICSRIFQESDDEEKITKAILYTFANLSKYEENSVKLLCSNMFANHLSKYILTDITGYMEREANGSGNFLLTVMGYKNRQILEVLHKTGIMKRLCELASSQTATCSNNKILEMILLSLQTYQHHKEEINKYNKMRKLLYSTPSSISPLISTIFQMFQAEFCDNTKRPLLQKILQLCPYTHSSA